MTALWKSLITRSNRQTRLGSLLLSLLLWMFILFPTGLTAQTDSRPQLQVTRSLESITLDGLLDEPAWQQSEAASPLTMLEPTEGGKPSHPTRISVLADRKHLIIGIYCYDDPSVVTSFSKNRDANLRNEDHIKIVLDPFLDGRTGYIFMINPGGARYDALVANQGEGENSDWDGLWEAVTVSQADGWSVEIRIPVQSLGFRKDLTQWGFNLQRRIQRNQETCRWASPELDYEITQTSRAGLLTGIPQFDMGIGLSIRPAIVASTGVPEQDTDTEYSLDPSLDINQKIGTNTLASVTINTDFAETEVDNRQTNLTRFSLYYPEKRTFFLEGADIFEFGLGLHRDLIAFNSRRIGLVGGQEVPLQLGGKLSGRVGDTNFGALAVRTGEKEGITSASSMGVIRAKQNVLAESYVGMIAAYGDPTGRGQSWLLGGDFTYNTSRFRGNKNFLVGIWAMATGRDDLTGDRAAYGFKIDYPNDLWDIAVTYKRIGGSFDPSLGFVPRRNVQLIRVGATYAPRPEWKLVRQMHNQLFITGALNLDNEWESYNVFTAPLNWRLESGERIEFNIVPTGEQLMENFEIADGVTIPPGAYHWIRYRLEAEFAAKRKVSGQVTWWFGRFYEGTLAQFKVDMTWKPSESFALDLAGEYNTADLPFGEFTQELVSGRVKINFTPNLQVKSLIQYDNKTRDVGTNTRLRWIFHPLGDLFLVYNHNLMDIGNRWVKTSNQFMLKVQYTFRR